MTKVKMLIDTCNTTKGHTKPDIHEANYDFTYMYTTLPPQHLKETIRNLLGLVCTNLGCDLQSYDPHVRMVYLNGKRTPREDQKMMMSLDTFWDMLYKLVDSTCFNSGGELWHWDIGVPMSTNCAGHIARYIASNMNSLLDAYNWHGKLQ